MYAVRKPYRSLAPHCFAYFLPGSTLMHNLLLGFRRTRRVCRPLLPILVRTLIVVFTAIELRPPLSPQTTGFATVSSPRLAPLLSRLGMVVGILSALLSIVFFDVRVFNFVTIAAIVIHFIFSLPFVDGNPAVARLMAFVLFHCTAILFSALVGRRRSIGKPSVLRSSVTQKSFFRDNLKAVRHVDVLEAGTRLQACVLALDYATAHSIRSSAFLLTLPFAFLFLAGYATQKNGTILLLLLVCLAFGSGSSPLLGFNFSSTISTVSGAFLALSVGPGLLTMDEWLASANQLCY